MRRSSLAFWTMACFLFSAAHGLADETSKPPTAEDVQYVQRFILRGVLKQMIGSFNSPGYPLVGDAFDIDLSNLPQKKISFTTTNSEAGTGPRTAYVAFPGSLTIDQVEKRTINHGSSFFRLSAIDGSGKFIIQVRAHELLDGSTATIYLMQETYGRILCMAEAVGVLILRPVAAAAAAATDEHALMYPKKEHLTARQVYEAGNPTTAIQQLIGQLVHLNVVVKIERSVPLAEIEIPKEVAGDAKPPRYAIQAHLISATTEAASLKKDQRFRIEGVIVDEGFSAYTIYLCNAKRL